MGLSASVIHLSEVSDFCSDEIWLFTLQTFNLEVQKFDFKAYAEEKQQEQFMKEMERKHNID